MSPTEIVCRWLDDAHAFDELDGFVVWLMDQPDEHHVPDRLLREAANGVRARRARGKAGEVDDAIRQAAMRPAPARPSSSAPTLA